MVRRRSTAPRSPPPPGRGTRPGAPSDATSPPPGRRPPCRPCSAPAACPGPGQRRRAGLVVDLRTGPPSHDRQASLDRSRPPSGATAGPPGSRRRSTSGVGAPHPAGRDEPLSVRSSRELGPRRPGRGARTARRRGSERWRPWDGARRRRPKPGPGTCPPSPHVPALPAGPYGFVGAAHPTATGTLTAKQGGRLRQRRRGSGRGLPGRVGDRRRRGRSNHAAAFALR